MIPNPLVLGFNPDPSVVRVDGSYYLVSSTCEYLPGLPVYRSTDLVRWTHIGNVATRPEQVDIEHVATPGGVWAPTIRHRDGVFYVIVTVPSFLGGRGCVLFTASDPAGPWSDGTPIAVDGIDPDLAWDDDGTAYVTYARFPTSIVQVRVDLATGQALEDPREMWSGTGLFAPESPHLYRRGEHWYLLIAEGGTHRGHAVSVARGPSPTGPFEGYPGNPILSARSTDAAIQNVGHGDFVATPDGGTAMVLLGVRPVGLAKASPLGRETFLTLVDWVDGWPRPRPVELAFSAEEEEVTFDFADPTVLDDPGWLAVRRTPAEIGSLTNIAGRLTITGDGDGLDASRPRFLGRRQRHLAAVFSTRIDATAGTGGLACRCDEKHWFALEAKGDQTGTAVTAHAQLAGVDRAWNVRLPAGEVELRIELTPPPPGFSPSATGGDRIRMIATAGGSEAVVAELDGRYWSFEVAQSFTGRACGVYATEGTVTFSDFRYRGSEAVLEGLEPL